jgi:hypothetical protein
MRAGLPCPAVMYVCVAPQTCGQSANAVAWTPSDPSAKSSDDRVVCAACSANAVARNGPAPCGHSSGASGLRAPQRRARLVRAPHAACAARACRVRRFGRVPLSRTCPCDRCGGEFPRATMSRAHGIPRGMVPDARGPDSCLQTGSRGIRFARASARPAGVGSGGACVGGRGTAAVCGASCSTLGRCSCIRRRSAIDKRTLHVQYYRRCAWNGITSAARCTLRRRCVHARYPLPSVNMSTDNRDKALPPYRDSTAVSR